MVSISCIHRLMPSASYKHLLRAVYLGAFLFSQCQSPMEPQVWEPNFRHFQDTWNRDLTQVIIEDIFTPPVASRIYAYANIAAYEAMVPGNSAYLSLQGQLNGLAKLPTPKDVEKIYFPLAAMFAFTQTARELVFAAERVDAYHDHYMEQVRSWGIPAYTIAASEEWGNTLADAVLTWANEDGYHQRQALPYHEYSEVPGDWTPTPPTYMEAIEPHWNTLRTFVLDSSKQFKPLPPTPFDTNPQSTFFEEAMEVYQVVKTAGEGEKEIAKFWDCNPNIAYFKGHVMLFHQKISPGGHWISIAGIASKKEDLDILPEAEAFAVTSIALADAFISCWDEKYRSNLIRPETYIERHIDSTWFPLLETPAFPEYTSGHSVISSAAALALTELIGENISFLDSTEVKYGLPARSFDSFFEASSEAAISRLYGGIHYRPAIENGVDQGKQIGTYILNKLKTRNPDS